MMHNRSISCSLSSTRGLDGLLQNALDCIHSRVVESWKTWHRETLSHLRAENLGRKTMCEKLVMPASGLVTIEK
jgi:hypothetical protein